MRAFVLFDKILLNKMMFWVEGAEFNLGFKVQGVG